VKTEAYGWAGAAGPSDSFSMLQIAQMFHGDMLWRSAAAGVALPPPVFPGQEEGEKGTFAQNPLPSLLFL
jgi:hypothetical protein